MEYLTPKEEADKIFNEFYTNNQPFAFEIEPAKKNAIFFVDSILIFLINRAGCKNENPNVIHYKNIKKEIEKLT